MLIEKRRPANSRWPGGKQPDGGPSGWGLRGDQKLIFMPTKSRRPSVS